MYETFGAHQGTTSAGKLEPRAEFRVFFPGRGPEPPFSVWAGDPGIKSLKVVGSFQAKPWDEATGLPLQPRDEPRFGGTLYSGTTGTLAPAFYEYKYLVTFQNGTSRLVGDPCARYSGFRQAGAGRPREVCGVVIDDPATYRPVAVTPLARRLPLRDLVIQEVMLDDFTRRYRNGRAPVRAFLDKLDHLVDLGVNAIEFMPWTAWPGRSFSWGYDVSLQFAPEFDYVNDPADPTAKLDGLRAMISACHQRNLHVILDGVFNHVRAATKGEGFPYFWLYHNVADCPFLGKYAGGGFFEDLDYENWCTHQFILDACNYWIQFGVDGLRLDYTKGYYDPSNPAGAGVGRLIGAVRAKNPDISITIEHIEGYAAIDVCNKVQADSCWYDPGYWTSRDALYRQREWLAGGRRDESKSPVQPEIMRLLDSQRDFGQGRTPTFYIENHDHAQVASNGEGRAHFFRTQPWAIALLTSPGAILLHNGQELADDHWVPEGGPDRVTSRPVRWQYDTDPIGRSMKGVYRKLIEIRRAHPGLRSGNFYPTNWNESWRRLQGGYGVDCQRGLVVYHRWGNGAADQLERFMVVLNFADVDQWLDVPVPSNGKWQDLLGGGTHQTADFWLGGMKIPSNWGLILFQ
jgi:pullulanase